MGKDIPGLLPCPFCGSSHVFVNQRPLGSSWVIECASCFARGPVIHRDRDNPAAAKRIAAEQWNNNRRTADVIKEWMSKKQCAECGCWFPEDELFPIGSELLCRDCAEQLKEGEQRSIYG